MVVREVRWVEVRGYFYNSMWTVGSTPRAGWRTVTARNSHPALFFRTMDSADWFSAPFTAAARCNSTAGRPALEHRQPTDRWKCDAMPLGWKEGSGCLERRTPSRSPANASHALPIPSASFSCAGGLRANFVDDERGTVRAALLRPDGFWKRRRLPPLLACPRYALRLAQPHGAVHRRAAVRRPRHLARCPRAEGHASGAAAKGERGADAPAGDCRGGGGGAHARRRRVRRAALWRAPPVLTV